MSWELRTIEIPEDPEERLIVIPWSGKKMTLREARNAGLLAYIVSPLTGTIKGVKFVYPPQDTES